MNQHTGLPFWDRLKVIEGTNRIVLDGDEFSLQPHHTHFIRALLRAAGDGTWWVTGTQLEDLPGCKNKNVSREMKNVKLKVPKLRKLITAKHGRGGGYRLHP